VRTETAIGAGQVSVPSVAVDLARQIFGDFRKHTVLLIGSGEMSETVAKLLRNAGAPLVVLGRNEARVAELAKSVGGVPRAFKELEPALIESDIVITSTSAPHYVIEHELVHRTRRKRRGRNLFFVDLAVPRDVDPRVEREDGVFLYNVDDFSRVVAESHSGRQREAERAETIIEAEADGYDRWAEAARVTPTLVALRDRLRAALEAELDRSLRGKLKNLGPAEREAMQAMLEAALNKMLHAPTARLREIAGDREFEGFRAEQLASALTELFALDRESEPETAVDDESEPSLPAGRAAGTGGR
jgi:glutamyl-tRNA reductase